MSALPEQLQRLAAALERLENALNAKIAEAEQFDRSAMEAEIEHRVEDRLPKRMADELQALKAGHEAEREGLTRKVDDAIARLENVLNR
jgi:hypothetical protein